MKKKILTEREQEVFNLLVLNKGTREISEALGISEKPLEITFRMQCKN